MPWRGAEFEGDAPTLGRHVITWMEAYLIVPDGPEAGEPLRLTREQAQFVLNFYALDPDDEGGAIRGAALHNTRLTRRAVLSRPKGWGKALALDTPLPTPSGFISMGCVEPGDFLLDESGNPVRVAATTPIMLGHSCFRVQFRDGTSMVADADHLWPVDQFTGSGRTRVLVTTSEMFDAGVIYERALTTGKTKAAKGGVSRWRTLPTPALVGVEATLPLPPYLLGYWLGDGDKDCPRVTVSETDLSHFLTECDTLGVEHGAPTRTGSSAYRVRFGKGWAQQALRDAGLLHNKHIPPEVFRASHEQRLAVFQGLLDSDGYIDPTGRHIEFTNTNRRLADGFTQLARTLGLYPRPATGTATIDGRVIGPKYRVKVTAYSDDPVFRLPRKAAHLKSPPVTQSYAAVRTITKITPIPSVPVRCVTVASETGLYLAGDGLIPTHNSPLMAGMCLAEGLADVVPDGWDGDGQPVGRSWASLGFKPKVQIVAVSEDQTANTWDPLLEMAREGPIGDEYHLEPLETFVNLPRGRIEYVTSAAVSREGFRPVFAAMDQALALDTPIPTPNGWTVMGDLQVGDLLIGSDGGPVKITEAKPVSADHDCWEVTFTDGTSLVASDGHLWQTRVASSSAAPKVRTTGQMVKDGRTFRVPAAPPFDTPTVPLTVPPYLLGLWLGDGTRAKCELSVHADDLAATQQALSAVGVETWPRRYAVTGQGYGTGGNQINLTFSRGTGYQSANRPAVAKEMAELPCYLDKHVPDDYLNGSIDQRTELVRGLMDSDGCATTAGVCTFVNTNQRLAEALVVALRSLGQVVSAPKWVPDPRYTGGGKYRVDFTPRGGFAPFRLPRKADRVRQHRNGPGWVTIRSITRVARVPVRCVAVDSDDHLFAAGTGGHLTHNTESWVSSNSGVRLAATIRRNLAKVSGSSIETPNAFLPGAGSVAEHSFKGWRQQKEGKLKGNIGGIYYDHREAPPDTEPSDLDSLTAGLTYAYGDSANVNGGWVPLERIVQDYWDPDTAPQDARRFYLNQVTHAEDQWITQPEWAARFDPDKIISDGDVITLGFDGSRKRHNAVADATALIATRLSDGHQFPVGVWEQPEGPAGDEWQVPVTEVDAAVHMAFDRWKVVGFYADPARWESFIAQWEATFGKDLQIKATRENPIEWWMTGGRSGLIVRMLDQYHSSILDGGMTHDGSYVLTRHILNARRRPSRSGMQIAKEHPDSPNKIDAAVAAALSWKARTDAISAGVTEEQRKPSRTLRRF